jgi:hypothetical protein
LDIKRLLHEVASVPPRVEDWGITSPFYCFLLTSLFNFMLFLYKKGREEKEENSSSLTEAVKLRA